MTLVASGASTVARRPPRISDDWSGTDVSLYLGRCQVDTPDDLVAKTWAKVGERRSAIGSVVDFGAGDGRFARHGRFRSYVGYEIDSSRYEGIDLPDQASMLHRCAFADPPSEADLCIGNPPFVRNQDLPAGWRTLVSQRLHAISGVKLSGLANAWQYFFLLALVTTADDGLCALVIPYEWVSRPSASGIRDYIRAQRWEVDVHRMDDAGFSSVLTTASITVIDKSARTGRWNYFKSQGGSTMPMRSTSGALEGHLSYTSKARIPGKPWAMRGLSPGTQRVLVLTEWERARCGLQVGVDVVPCITSLRDLPPKTPILDAELFDRVMRQCGRKCWLVRSDVVPSRSLRAYLDAVPEEMRSTATCMERDEWWRFNMPSPPRGVGRHLLQGTGAQGVYQRSRSRRGRRSRGHIRYGGDLGAGLPRPPCGE